MSGAAALVEVLGWYAWFGAAAALAFLGFGVDRVDESARGSYPFRVLLVPGVMLLWPLVLWRWLALERTPEPDRPWRARHSPRRRLHGRAAWLLALALPLLLATGFLAREMGPTEQPPVQLSAP